MSSADSPPPPLAVSIPKPASRSTHNLHHLPSLKEILANTSPAPWTLTAFMAYLSVNHCLETLEFTMDAGRYKKHYSKMMSRATAVDGLPPAKDREYVQALWQRLVEAYIRPNGSREVNLPSSVRDPIINLPLAALPPAPENLDPAVAKIYELMEESVLMPFLHSVYPQSAHPDSMAAAPERPPSGQRGSHSRSSHGQHTSGHRPRSSTPPRSNTSDSIPRASPAQFRRSAPSATVPAPIHKSSIGARSMNDASARARSVATDKPRPVAGAGAGAAVVAAGASVAAPPAQADPGAERAPPTNAAIGAAAAVNRPSNGGPVTPPITPPMGETAHDSKSENVWKKLSGRFSGMKGVTHKKSVGTLRREAEAQKEPS